MSTRTIRECDRCHHEITDKMVQGRVEIEGGTRAGVHELCSSCASKLAKFMAGEELEVPP